MRFILNDVDDGVSAAPQRAPSNHPVVIYCKEPIFTKQQHKINNEKRNENENEILLNAIYLFIYLILFWG